MQLNKVLKSVVAALALSLAATTASANVVNASAADNGQFLFTSWNSSGSYSFQLSTAINDLVGADTVNGDLTGNSTNSLAAPILTASGTYQVLLTGYQASAYGGVGSNWNLVAADVDARNRVVYTQRTGGVFNANNVDNVKVANLGNTFTNYEGLLAAVGDFTSIATADPAYGNGAAWGDSLASNISGTSTGAGGYLSSMNLYMAYQKSTDLDSSKAGVQNLLYRAFLTSDGTSTYLNIAAVPEADTSGMMIAGMGLMAFIARRRKTNLV